MNYNDKKNQPLDVADSFEEFNDTTIRQLKNKTADVIPGAG